MVNFKKALRTPEEYFDSPQQVLETSGLSTEEKLSILQQWEHDVQLLDIAEEENMPTAENISAEEPHDLASQIKDAIHKLENSG